jgi:hypothetical protein
VRSSVETLFLFLKPRILIIFQNGTDKKQKNRMIPAEFIDGNNILEV